MVYFIILVTAAMFIDLRILRNYNGIAYRYCFKEFVSISILLALLAGVTASVAEQKEYVVFAYFLIFLVPFYSMRKRKFIQGNKDKWLNSGKVVVASGACSITIYWISSAVLILLLLNGLSKVLFPGVTQVEILMLSSILSSGFALFLIYNYAKEIPGRSFLSRMGIRRPRQDIIKVFLFSMFLGILFAFFASCILMTREVQPDTPFNEMMSQVDTVSGFFLFIAASMLMAPFFEEIIFRGYYYSVLKKTKGTVFAVIAVALAFSFLHVDQYWGDWTAILMVTILGVAMTLLRAFSCSTIPSIIMHYSYNIGVLIFSVMFMVMQNPLYYEYVAKGEDYSKEKKIEILKEVIENKPEFSDAYNELALIYANENKDYEQAMLFVDKALHYAPDKPLYLDTKAMILIKQDKLEEAKRIEERIQKKHPGYSISQYLEP